MADESPWILDTTTEKFEADVIERSKEVPVVVDFWAPWCEPCRLLAPLLESRAQQSAGKFILVKVNIEEAQELAAAVGVQSIPFVVAFHEGQAVNQFMGILSEEQLDEWFGTFIPSAAQELVAEAESIEPNDAKAAAAKYQEALQLEPNDASIKIHLARCLVSQGQNDESRQIITELETRGFLEPEAERIKSQLELQAAAAESGGVTAARSASEANPDDLSLQLKLADALAVSGQNEEAMEICLQIIQTDKSGVGVEAKETMVKMFDVLGNESELVSTYRRKLATAWY